MIIHSECLFDAKLFFNFMNILNDQYKQSKEAFTSDKITVNHST